MMDLPPYPTYLEASFFGNSSTPLPLALALAFSYLPSPLSKTVKYSVLTVRWKSTKRSGGVGKALTLLDGFIC